MEAVGKEGRGHGGWFGPILALGMNQEVESPWEKEEMGGRALCVCIHHHSLEEDDDEG